MPLFPKMHFGKKKQKPITEKTISQLLDQRLQGYEKMDGIKEYIRGLERDKKKLEIYDNLSKGEKIRWLKYVARKRGINV